MTEGPQEYDRAFTKQFGSDNRLRIGFDAEAGDVTRSIVQLEHRRGEDWSEVVRADHNPDSELAHDVTTAGVHLDIYREGVKYRTEYIGPPLPAGRALDRAEGQ